MKAARRQLETEVPLLPRLELQLGKITVKVPTKSSFVCASMSSLKVSNNTPNDSGRYDRESLSNIRFHTLGLCVSTPEHVLIGKTDVNVTIAIESTQSVAVNASLSAIRCAISPQHFKLLSVDLVRENLSLGATDIEEEQSDQVAEQEKDVKEEDESKAIPKPTLRLKFCASGFGLQVLKSNTGYKDDQMWASSDICSNSDSELSLELTELGVQVVGNAEKLNVATKLPLLRIYRACEKVPILRLDVEKSQRFAVTMSMNKGIERLSVSFPGLSVSLVSDSKKFVYVIINSSVMTHCF